MSSSHPIRFVQLAALWAYAVSQPVFSLLEGNPDFLVVRGSTKAVVVVFALLLAFGPAAVALAVEGVVSLASARVAVVLHLVFLGLFAVPLGLMMRACGRERVVRVGGVSRADDRHSAARW